MLPHPLLLPLRIIPDAVHAELFARAFNHLLRGQPLAARLPEINGKSVCIHIRDAASEIHFRIDQGRLQPAAAGLADVRISGKVEDFWQLATRREDPDTLFFNRRLCIEGDTETGVHVKNLLDALDYDWEAHFRDVLGETLGGAAFAVFQRAIDQRLAAS
ncbi:MAG: SCP2 sterol-binding domain-containing protein [Sulfuricaulis sp.]|uniref:ubiquinone anaerobic biosynthesis accessory factor UbiT n=1 Tax=Sulfuricaulis sp. TaxID=2003553 RepID=UPI0025E2F292|nr:SCP2 sterol-binding domain-containing protein [Sulfuricaulis sp.]MCR4346711.1 SCP2 sterol-binding domain-containing protein [Sulfuricaulis sp.]